MTVPPAPVAVILAGGRSRRMHGRDKGRVELCGKRLIDRVVERLRPQALRVVLSAPHDYGTGLEYVPDLSNVPQGPVAGIRSVHRWLEANYPEAECFVTAPVDGPFLPGDLSIRLCARDVSAIASDGENDHPTFACWKQSGLAAVLPRLAGRPHLSLKALAGACAAQRVIWPESDFFFNVNSPDDIEAATRRLCGKGCMTRQ
jgi:molybdenum cofactor guanylyltransferase